MSKKVLTEEEKSRIIQTVQDLLWKKVGNVDYEIEIFKSIETDSVLTVCTQRFDSQHIPHYIRFEKR